MKEKKYDSYADTLTHIRVVSKLLNEAAIELLRRANCHDDSKLISPEKEYFDDWTPRLSATEFGSKEYKLFLDKLSVGILHHYKNNSHHPEHYENMIEGMNLFDIIEMFFDWKAASERNNGGNIYKSINYCKGRFNISEQLTRIFENTAEFLKYERPTTELIKQIKTNTP
jgi:hypothetical protein